MWWTVLLRDALVYRCDLCLPLMPGAYVYGTGRFVDPLRFTDAIWERASAAGFHIDCFTSEYDSPQFEFTLTYDDA